MPKPECVESLFYCTAKFGSSCKIIMIGYKDGSFCDTAHLGYRLLMIFYVVEHSKRSYDIDAVVRKR